MRGHFGRLSRSMITTSILYIAGPGSMLSQEVPPDSGKVAYPVLKVDGQVRLRGEGDGRTVDVDPDFGVLSRLRVGLNASLYEWIDVYAQIQDARAWGSELNTLTDASADALDLHQGYVDLGSGPGFTARLGRQEVKLGDERLVGAGQAL